MSAARVRGAPRAAAESPQSPPSRWRLAFDGAPAALLVCAALALGAYALVEALGFRDAVAVLSGTMPDGPSRDAGVARGVAFVLAWFGAVLVAPVMALGALLLAALRGLVTSRRRGPS